MPTSIGEGRERLYALIALGAAAIVSVALVVVLTDEWVLSFDDLTYFVAARGYDPGSLLESHSGHLVLTSRLLFAGALDVFGPGDYVVFSGLLRAFVIATVVLLFLLLARRIRALAALLPCVVILFLGTAWTVTLGPGALCMPICFATGLGGLLALDRDPDDRTRQLVAAAMLTLSLASWTGGLAFVAAAGVRLATEPGRWGSRLWVVALPVVLYLPWFLIADPQSQDTAGEPELTNLVRIFEVAAVSLSATVGGLLGVGYDPSPSAEARVWAGVPFALLAAALFTWYVARGWMSPAGWSFLALLVSYWGLLAISTSEERQPDDPRHLFLPALALILIAGDLLRRARIGTGALAAGFAIAAVSLTANAAMLVHRGEYLRDYSATLRAEMSAIELAGSGVPDEFLPLEHDGLMSVRVGPYRDAVQRYGSPVSAKRDLAASDPEIREHTERLIAQAHGSPR